MPARTPATRRRVFHIRGPQRRADIPWSCPTLHAAGPGGNSVAVRCQLLQGAIDAAIATFGGDSGLVAFLQGQYAAYCSL